MSDELTKEETRTLVAAVKTRVKAAKADLHRQVDLLLARFEQELCDRFDPVDKYVEKLFLEAADTMVIANTTSAAQLANAGYPAGWAPRLTLERMPRQPVTAALRTRLRTQAKAAATAMRRDGIARLDAAEADLVIKLTAPALGDNGFAKLGELPTLEELMAPLLPDLEQAVKQLTAGETV